MSWSAIVLILMCLWSAVLLALLIRQEKKRKRLLNRLDKLLAHLTARGVEPSMIGSHSTAYRNAAKLLGAILNKEYKP